MLFRSLQAENDELREQLESMETPQQIDLEKLANGIQKWIVEEYSPMVQTWVVEHYSEANNENVVEEAMDQMKDYILEEMAPAVQKW